MKTAKPILVLLLMFLAGIAVGVVGTRYVVRRTYQQAAREGGFFRDRMERELIDQLNLTEEQQDQVKKIFARSWEEFRQLRTEFHPRFTNIAARTEADIKAILTPEQKAEFEKQLAEKKANWRAPGGRPDRPPGPPRHDWGERTNFSRPPEGPGPR